LNNSDIKNLEKLHHKKYRDEFNKFLIEGIHLIEECLRSDIYREMLETIFVREDFENESAIEKIKNSNHSAGIEILDDRKFSRLSETVNSQGIIGLVSRPDLSLHNEKIKTDKSNKIVVAIDNISDPGNLGTIIRTCHWFGADELIISKNSVDVFNSKVIRASQGSLFFLKIRNELNLESEIGLYRNNQYSILLSHLSAEENLSDLKLSNTENYLIVFGNEANGISNSISENKNYRKFRINGYSECESLNAAVAAGIVLYEFRK